MKNSLCLLAILFAGYLASAQRIACTTIERHPKSNKSLLSRLDSVHRGLADNYYLWNNGATIRVKFLSGSKRLQNKVRAAAMQWQNHANIKFQFVTAGPAEIRIRLGQGQGHNSYIGIMSTIDPESESMNLDTTDFRTDLQLQGTVLHEFGHALGLLHEHSSPVSGIQWNKPLIYKEYWARYGWDSATVDAQVFDIYRLSYTNGTRYDQKSIMHYPIESWETLNGYTVPWNYHLSANDKQLIAALYPKSVRNGTVPRILVNRFSKMQIHENDAKGGLSIYPSFEISAFDKSAKVYVLTHFLDEYGDPIMDTDGEYSFDNFVTAMTSVTAIKDRKAMYNRTQRDLEVFIPYEQLELDPDMSEVYVFFRVIYVTEDGEIKNVYFRNPVAYTFSGKHKFKKTAP